MSRISTTPLRRPQEMKSFSREEFEEAYLLWAGAVETLKLMMGDAMMGKTADVDAIHQQLAEIDRLHENWLARSTGLVHWQRT